MQLFDWPCLMNAGGTCKTVEDVERIVRAVDAVVVGSVTVDPRPGNSGEVYWYDTRTTTSYNALNMPNAGAHAYRHRLLPDMLYLTHHADKPLILSVAGFSIQEFEDLTLMAADLGVDGVELNFGCPNTGEAIFSFDPDAMHDTIYRLRNQLHKRGPFLLAKVSPISDPSLRRKVACALSLCDGVVTTNTLPNARGFRADGSSAIQATKPQGGSVTVGGAAGAPLRAISRTFAAEVREWLPDVAVLRAGGVSSGVDMAESEQAGVQAVQVATALLEEGPRVFTRLREEYAALSHPTGNVGSLHDASGL